MEERFHVALIRAAAAHAKYCRQRFQKLDLTTGQPKVLSHLLAAPGVTQRELAESCRVEPATMTVLLRCMEKKDLVRRECCVSGGKRASRVFLTQLGAEKAGAVMDVVDRAESECFRDFTIGERAELIALLNRVTGNLN